MAMRRQQMQLGMDEFGDREYGGPMDDDMMGMFDPPSPSGSGQAPNDDGMPETDLFDLDAYRDAGVFDRPIAGNSESYREMGPGLAPMRGGRASEGAPQIAIPQGATTDAALGGYDAPETIDVPMQAQTPSPNAMGTAMGGAPPATVGAGVTRRPQLQPSAVSSLFDEGGGGPLFAAGSGGLNEGGYGLPGSGGPPKATEMMKALLQALKLG